MDKSLKNRLLKAVNLAQAGEWAASHVIVQDEQHANACWIHAVLHKIEGDKTNSLYWYARCQVRFEDYPDAMQELNTIQDFLI
jgi:hypothetical protein